MSGFWSWITGNGDAADAQAANVARQWQTLLDNATNYSSKENFDKAVAAMVKNYGEPPAAVRAALADAAAAIEANHPETYSAPQIFADLNGYYDDYYDDESRTAAADGFVEGVKSVPGQISGGIAATVAAFWKGLPALGKLATAAALCLVALPILTRAGVLGPRRKR
ncbi:MAG: hypothetical protein LBM92_03000 [Opitutaceae bacterium]|jgi:hypothetical protein|nr:hypothetical protein [Opitutaceae bacterium]